MNLSTRGSTRRWTGLVTLSSATVVVGTGLQASAGASVSATTMSPAVTTSGVHFVNAGGSPIVLRVNFVRIRVLWRDLEPATQGSFSANQLAQLDAVVSALNGDRVAVELDLSGAAPPRGTGPPPDSGQPMPGDHVRPTKGSSARSSVGIGPTPTSSGSASSTSHIRSPRRRSAHTHLIRRCCAGRRRFATRSSR